MTAFHLSAPRFNAELNQLAFDFDVPGLGAFTEHVRFPESAPLTSLDPDVRTRLSAMAALLIGTSYFKAAPAQLIQTDFAVTEPERRLIALAYGPGLGEFYVRNGLAYPPSFEIEADSAPDRAQGELAPGPIRAVSAFGGGKDSHVAASILTKAGASPERVSVILSDKVGARLQTMSEEAVTLIWRTIDPRLIELSRSGDALNGHIPITGINSCLLAVYAAARQMDWVVFANERAASEPTLEVNGHPVNHQFSKSLEFEDALRAGFAAAGATLEYFSILRPVSELWTAHYLAERTDALDIFASCNRNFVFAGPNALDEGRRWCGQCAKCVYTAVLLAPFLSPERHAEVFQSRPLHDPVNAGFLREIAGLTDAKPWECVGERREVAAAIAHLLTRPEWRETPLIQGVESELFAHWDRADLQAAWAEALDARSEHRMPADVAAVMKATSHTA